MVERALILRPKGPIEFEEMIPLPAKTEDRIEMPPPTESLSINQLMVKHIQSVLDMTNGKINGRNGAAELLGLNASTLRHRLRQLNIPFGHNAYKKKT